MRGRRQARARVANSYSMGVNSPGPPAQGRSHLHRHLRRRERLYDVIGGYRIRGPRDDLVPAVGGDEDDGKVGQVGHLLHQHEAVAPGKHQIQQDQPGPVRSHETGEVLRVARDQRCEVPAASASQT